MSQLIRFYAGEGADHRGRTLNQILTWNDRELEQTHDYIQWLFPLIEPSRFNPDAPLLTAQDRDAFQLRPELRNNLLRALERMLEFYGYSIGESARQPELRAIGGRRKWLTPGNHNFLRITRILTSLRLLDLNEYAQAFFDQLEELYASHSAVIGKTTFDYWRQAATSRLLNA
jgi:opioid growth factor receptor-like protein